MKKSDDAPLSPTAFKAPSRGGANAASKPPSQQRRSVMIASTALVMLVLGTLLSVKTVVVTPTPASVQLKVDNGIGIAVGHRILGFSGAFDMTASATGYHNLSFTAISNDDGGPTVISLQKLPGHIHFDITPDDGARILIDDEAKQPSADGMIDIDAGHHAITVLHPRYLPYKAALDVEGMGHEQSMSIAMERAWANISLSSRPQGAHVFKDGELLGTTPFVAELLPDIYVLNYQLDGYEDHKQLIEIDTQKDDTLAPVLMKPARASLRVQTTPNGARLFLNGNYVGLSPKTLAVEPDHSHKISAELSGYQKENTTSRLSLGSRKDITLKLEKISGSMTFTSTPPAEVWIEGKNHGLSPVSLDLHAIEHTVTYKKQGYRAVDLRFSPDPNRQQTIHTALMTESEARHKEAKPTYETAVGHTMVRLKPGRFMMGAPRGEPGQRSNETLRDTELTRPYYISQHEVTRSQFARSGKPAFAGGSANEPVTNISWVDAALYCNWLSQMEGLEPFYKTRNGSIIGFDVKARGYRLPTEAEWAWAARVGAEGKVTLRFPWGDADKIPANAGNYGNSLTHNDGFTAAAPVGQFAPNIAKLYDMGGNVAEWVNDYHSLPLPEPGQLFVDPMGPSRGLDFVIKGGSWKTDTLAQARLAYRDYDHVARADVGFRIARWID